MPGTMTLGGMARRTSRGEQSVKDGHVLRRRLLAAVAGIFLVAVFLFGIGVAYTLGFGYDSHAYWEAAHRLDHLYDRPPLAKDAYLYSPAFVQLLWPIAQLPWPVFAVVWGAISAAAFFWLLNRLPPVWFVLGMLACVPEILTGNVYGLMAVSIVLGVRRGWPWVLPLITKVTPGAVGLAFFALRPDLRRTAAVLLWTALVIGVSVAISPTAWIDWFQFLVDNWSSSATSAIVPFPLRILGLVAALALTWLAARRRSYWALALVSVLVSPTVGPNTLTLLAAVPRLRAAQVHDGQAPTERTLGR
jgi:Glycosyltransferase family 87